MATPPALQIFGKRFWNCQKLNQFYESGAEVGCGERPLTLGSNEFIRSVFSSAPFREATNKFVTTKLMNEAAQAAASLP